MFVLQKAAVPPNLGEPNSVTCAVLVLNNLRPRRIVVANYRCVGHIVKFARIRGGVRFPNSALIPNNNTNSSKKK